MTLRLSVRTGGTVRAIVADSTTVDDLIGNPSDGCPYCGGEWQPPQTVAKQGTWDVVQCTECDATKITASSLADPPPP